MWGFITLFPLCRYLIVSKMQNFFKKNDKNGLDFSATLQTKRQWIIGVKLQILKLQIKCKRGAPVDRLAFDELMTVHPLY